MTTCHLRRSILPPITPAQGRVRMSEDRDAEWRPDSAIGAHVLGLENRLIWRGSTEPWPRSVRRSVACATERRLGGVDRLNVCPIAPSSQLYQATDIHGPAHAEAVRHQDSRIVRRPYGREEPSKRRSPEIVRHDASDLPNPPSLVRRLPELLDNGGCQQCCNDDQREGSFGGSLGLIRHAAIVAAATSTCDPYCCRLGDAPERLGWDCVGAS